MSSVDYKPEISVGLRLRLDLYLQTLFPEKPSSGTGFNRRSNGIGMIEIFTPSYADEAITNAQTLTVKEIVSRLDSNRFKVTMLHMEEIDSRIAARPNTHCLQWKPHGNTIRLLKHYLFSETDLYFYPHEGPLDRAVFATRRFLKKRTGVITHIVSGGLDSENVRDSLVNSIREADAVFGNNRYVSQLIEQRFAIRAETIHNGIDRRYFFPAANRKPPDSA